MSWKRKKYKNNNLKTGPEYSVANWQLEWVTKSTFIRRQWTNFRESHIVALPRENELITALLVLHIDRLFLRKILKMMISN